MTLRKSTEEETPHAQFHLLIPPVGCGRILMSDYKISELRRDSPEIILQIVWDVFKLLPYSKYRMDGCPQRDNTRVPGTW